jgi:hypothetical protein
MVYHSIQIRGLEQQLAITRSELENERRNARSQAMYVSGLVQRSSVYAARQLIAATEWLSEIQCDVFQLYGPDNAMDMLRQTHVVLNDNNLRQAMQIVAEAHAIVASHGPPPANKRHAAAANTGNARVVQLKGRSHGTFGAPYTGANTYQFPSTGPPWPDQKPVASISGAGVFRASPNARR